MSRATDIIREIKSPTPDDIAKKVMSKGDNFELKKFGYMGKVVANGILVPDFMEWIKIQNFDKLEKIFKSIK